MPKKKTLFLDRDGVLNIDKGYVHKIEDFEYVPGIVKYLQKAIQNGFQLIIITNQSGIGRHYYSEASYTLLTEHLIAVFRKEGIEFVGIYHCPHTQEDDCDCRKPKPGLFRRAIQAHSVDIGSSWVIGDKKRDLEAARAAGITAGILIDSNDLKKLDALTSPFK
jgi:D-glycero-D-manno-heptose 1,7-bisphosphate phosphatase